MRFLVSLRSLEMTVESHTVIYPSLARCRHMLRCGIHQKIGLHVRLLQRLLQMPASCYRNNNDGSLNNVGNNGNYWCSKPNSSNANNLNFNSGNVNMNNNNRANGYSVRCVQNLHACLFLKDMIGHTETDVIFPFCNHDSLKSKYALHSCLSFRPRGER